MTRFQLGSSRNEVQQHSQSRYKLNYRNKSKFVKNATLVKAMFDFQGRGKSLEEFYEDNLEQSLSSMMKHITKEANVLISELVFVKKITNSYTILK